MENGIILHTWDSARISCTMYVKHLAGYPPPASSPVDSSCHARLGALGDIREDFLSNVLIQKTVPGVSILGDSGSAPTT